jgi:hypothetical protein
VVAELAFDRGGGEVAEAVDHFAVVESDALGAAETLEEGTASVRVGFGEVAACCQVTARAEIAPST